MQLKRLKGSIEEFVDQHLPEKPSKPQDRNKIIHESIWGTHLYRRHEIAFQGTFQAMIRLVDSLGNTLVQTEQLHFEVTEYKGHDWFVNLGVRFPSLQLYRVKLVVDGKERLEVPLMVQQTEAIPPQAG